MSKKNYRLLIYAAVITTLVIAVGIFVASAQFNTTEQTSGTPRIAVTPTNMDWGTVSAAQGSVSKQFTVTNTGDGDLIIKKISTSCGCTTATLETSKRTTRPLGMDHGNLPSIREIIAPGESALLTVTFDPNFHYVRGLVDRVIYIASNDPQQRETSINNRLKVVE